MGEPPSLSGGCHDNSTVSLATGFAVSGSVGGLGGPENHKINACVCSIRNQDC